jgi:thioredoxin-like negative regulator of GroEL
MSPRHILAALALTFAALAPALAKLEVGSPAPEARPKVMIQGETVGKLDDSKTYLFEFWATWCGPCVQMVPHLDQLHRDFGPKGLVILATSVWEDDQPKVDGFVKARAGKMTYRVGFDADQAMAKGWLEAAGVDGIPHAFVVRKGKIVWAGHPGRLDDKLVASLIDGTYSPAKAEQEAATAAAKELELNDKMQALASAVQEKRWDAAEKLLKEVLPLVPAQERADLEEGVGDIIALGRGDPSRVYKRIARFAEEAKDDLKIQNEAAWQLATNVEFEGKRDLALASTLAERAVKLSEGTDRKADCLDTLARIRFMQGNKDDAIKLQQQAVESAPPEIKPLATRILESYRKGVLPPVPTSLDEGE